MKLKKLISTLAAITMAVTSVNAICFASDMPPSKAIIWNAEFDGNDTTTDWRKFSSSESASTYNFTSKISNGVLSYTSTQITSGRMGAEFSPALDVTDLKEVCWETKIKYANKVPSTDKKMFYLNDDTVMIYLLEGKVAYGGTSSDDSSKISTGFEIKSDVWYTFKVNMDFKNSKYSLSVNGDDNSSYTGAKTNFATAGTVTGISSLRIPRAFTTGLTFSVDYIRIWDDSKVTKVDVLYDGENLDSQKDMPLEFDIDVKFTEAITNGDISKITINKDATLSSAKLTNDNKTLTLTVSDLDYETEYEITVPEIGNNPSKKVKFTTAEYVPPEVKVVYGNKDEELDGAKDISYNFNFKVLFECPIEESDVDEITIDNDTEFASYELSSDGKTLKLTLSNLASYTRYTVSIPALKGNAAKDVSFTTYNDLSYLYEMNFDDTDVPGGWKWRKGDLNGDVASLTPNSGVQELSISTIGSINPSICFDEKIDLNGKENFFVETRMKFSRSNGSSGATDLSTSGKPLIALVDATKNEVWAIAGAYVMSDSILGIGGNGNSNAEALDYKLEFDTWYTFKIHYNQKTQKFTLFVSDDSGKKTVQSEWKSIPYPGTFNVDNLSYIQFPHAFYTATTLDYVRIWSTDFELLKSSIANNEPDVRNDSDIDLDFSAEIDENTAKYISLTDSLDNVVETEITVDGRKVNIYPVAGLKNDEVYTLTIPVSVKDKKDRNLVEKKIVFATEKKAFRLENKKSQIVGNTVSASVDVINPSDVLKNVAMIVAVYDENNNLVAMKNIEKGISAGGNDTISTSFDVTGLGADHVNVYLWSGNRLISEK